MLAKICVLQEEREEQEREEQEEQRESRGRDEVCMKNTCTFCPATEGSRGSAVRDVLQYGTCGVACGALLF